MWLQSPPHPPSAPRGGTSLPQSFALCLEGSSSQFSKDVLSVCSVLRSEHGGEGTRVPALGGPLASVLDGSEEERHRLSSQAAWLPTSARPLQLLSWDLLS